MVWLHRKIKQDSNREMATDDLRTVSAEWIGEEGIIN
jgi:hypothetical protein